MKTAAVLLLTALAVALGPCASCFAQASDAAPAEKSAPPDMTQGEFARLVVREANGAKYFEGPITPLAAAEKLASLGLRPEGGWHVLNPLTRNDLESAYRALTTAGAAPADPSATTNPAPAAAAVSAPAAGDAVSRMTVAELIDAIVQEMRRAFARITRERMPISPAGWTWP